MFYENPALDGFRSAMHRLLGWDFVARRVPVVRRRLALVGAIERLEGRVVPATILVTSLLNSGCGTLRAAIEKANLAPNNRGSGAHGDTIKFAHSVRGTILLTSALPALSTDMVISGPGPSALRVARSGASQTPAFRIFTVGRGAVIKITGLTITGGSAADGGGIGNAGSLSLVNTTISGNSAVGPPLSSEATLGGGIENSGTLSVTDSTFSGNSASGGFLSFESGGGIGNSGTLSVTDSTFSSNSATSAITPDLSAGGAASGGGIGNSGTLSVTNSTFSGNSASVDGGGGGIGNFGTLTVATVTNSTFSGNSATGPIDSSGGGINNGGTLTVTNSTISDNSATASGGGIDNGGTLTVINSTISGNSVTGTIFAYMFGSGGGIDNQYGGTLTVTNSTISGNSATVREENQMEGYGGGIADSGVGSITYVTVADNSAASGGGVAITFGAQSLFDSIDSIFQNTQGGNVSVAAGVFRSLGHNLFSDDPGISIAPTDRVNTNPLLGPLANNGGPTLTQALLPGSPAINAGIPVVGITTDQRGAPRPAGSAPDIGAFQVQPPLTVLSLQRSGTDHHPTVLVLTFNLPLNAIPAESLANYRLVRADDGRVISIRSARYDAASQSVTLRPKTRLLPSQTYSLTVIGTPPGGLTTTVGAYLAGAGPDQPGTDYVAAVNRKAQDGLQGGGSDRPLNRYNRTSLSSLPSPRPAPFPKSEPLTHGKHSGSHRRRQMLREGSDHALARWRDVPPLLVGRGHQEWPG